MIPYLKKQASTTVLMVHDQPYVMLAGEIHNSSSSSPAYMESAWAKADELALNTLLVPISWELLEPKENLFDFSLVDTLLSQARAHNKKLVLLWFGAWKNAQCYYAPEWVKSDLSRFRRAEMIKGQKKIILTDFHNLPYTTLSAFCPATREADAKTFANLMAHLRAVDEAENTVIAVQVENETGFMGAAREHSDEADATFAGNVPPDLVEAMLSQTETMVSDVREALLSGSRTGSWEQVFGPVAEEMFTAWYTASYVEAVAAAGKAEYPLPMVVNCWLDKGHKPGRFPSGGPVARAMEVWKLAAPSIDVIAPDIYVPYFCDVCDSYCKLGNPLFIPEAASHAYAAARELYAVGHYHAICYSPFGFEELGEPFGNSIGILFGMDTSDPALRTPQAPAEYSTLNQALTGLQPLLGERLGTDKLQAVICERPEENRMTFGLLGFDITFGGGTPGACMVVQTGKMEFFLLAMHCMVTPVSLDSDKPHTDILCLEDGEFDSEHVWQPLRRLNGDEATRIRCEKPILLHLRLLQYQ